MDDLTVGGVRTQLVTPTRVILEAQQETPKPLKILLIQGPYSTRDSRLEQMLISLGCRITKVSCAEGLNDEAVKIRLHNKAIKAELQRENFDKVVINANSFPTDSETGYSGAAETIRRIKEAGINVPSVIAYTEYLPDPGLMSAEFHSVINEIVSAVMFGSSGPSIPVKPDEQSLKFALER